VEAISGYVNVGTGTGRTPTGTVVVTAGSYSSGPLALSIGEAAYSIPAGTLALGTDTISASYTPDSSSTPFFTASSGTTSVQVLTGSLIYPKFQASIPSPTILTTSVTPITFALSSAFAPTVNFSPITPTGTITLSSGAYTSPPMPIAAPSSSIAGFASGSIPAGTLAVGPHTLTATYTPDAAGSAYYTSVSTTLQVTVITPPATNTSWTWEGGNSALYSLPASSPVTQIFTNFFVVGLAGSYGTPGVSSTSNLPGSRSGASSWTDRTGNFWLFGGNGVDSADNSGSLNDLWSFNPSNMQWTWVAGASSVANISSTACTQQGFCGSPGVYGMRGTGASGNTPGSRTGQMSWTDSAGNFWLYGGNGPDSASNFGVLNDLWEFSPTQKVWAWVGGNSTFSSCPYQGGCSVLAVYGTLGTPSSTTTPGNRQYASTWTDLNGNLWLFGGEGYGTDSYLGTFNDLWKFSPSTGQWTWVAGTSGSCDSSNKCGAGVYGTLGTAASGNNPGARIGATSWTDTNGNLWLFGGSGMDANGTNTSLNDLWEFSPSTELWTWQGGTNIVGSISGVKGIYGTQGVASSGNIPGGRSSAQGWTDASGNFWLFGGSGTDASGLAGVILNDLWEYSPSTKQWTWQQGSSTAPPETYLQNYNIGYNGGQPGVYGTLGSSAAGNIPGARSGLVEWTDSIGNFWLFGGEGDDANSLEGPLNDLWKYQLSASTAPDFTITTLTPTMTVSQAGNGATFMVTITPLNGFSGQIALGVCCDSALGVTVPASITIPSNGTAQNFNFTITSAPQLGVGTFSETVTGETVGGLQHGLTLNLVVQNPGLTPAVTVTPTSSSITTAQADMVTVTVNGGSGNPVATGSVTLTSGTYTSGAVTLSGGSAMINIPAGSLAAGPDTLTASYTPDSNSSSIYNGAMGSNTVTVTTVVSAPVAGLAPSPVTFTGQVAGTISQPMTVTLSNTGNAALTGITPSLTGINPSDFAITTGTNACGSSLAAGANCSIYVIFTPASAASFTATLSVADNASGSPQTATLNGTGVSFVSNVGTAEAAQMVTVPITTAGMLSSIQALTLGAPNLDFAATPGGTCEGGTAYTVGQSCTVNVIFTPKYSGTRWGAVVLSNASGSVLGTTYLPGTGLGPQLAFRFSNNISSYTSASGSFNGVAVDASGDIFIAGSADVTEIPAGCLSATCYISIGGGNLSNLQSMAVDGSGNLYVSNSNPSLVMEIPRGCTSSSCAITLGGGFTSPYAVAVDGNGNVYVADSYNNAVKMMPPGCLSSSCVTKLGGGFFVTQGITVDGKGNVYVADDNLMVNNSGSIKEMPPGCLSSACVTTLLANLPDPQGLAVDAAGDVYFTQVVPDDAGAYEMLAVGGSIPSSPTVVPLITPFEGQGVAVDGPGNVYLVSGSSLFKQDAVDPPGQIFETPTNVGSQDDDDDPLTVTAQNIGNMSLTFTGIAPATNFPIDAPSTNCSTSSPLVEGGTCDVGVDFAPTAAGPLSGNVILTDNNLNVAGSTQPIALSGTGVAVLGPPTASLSPGPLNFGGVQIETTSPALIETVTNTGGGSVSISGVSIAQTGTNAFFLGTGANQCTNTTSLSNAQSCNVYVTFNPSLNGHTYNATLDIADNASGSPQTASLTGVGDYFNQDVGNSTSKEPVSVFITTGGTLSATNVVTTGAQTPDYTLQTGGTCAIGTAYSAGQVCTVDVIFVPQFSGARNGAIYLTTSSGAVLGTTFLQGTGNAPQIIFGPVAPQTAIGYITGLAGVAVDAAGDLFYVNGSDRLIEAPVSGPAVTVANLSSLISDGTPSNVAIDPSGNLFVASNSEAPLIEVPSTGPGTWGTPVSINTGVGNVAQVAVDSFGNLYITAPAQNTVYQLPFTGSGYGTPVALPFPGSGAFKPQGVAVDPSLDVYAIGQNASNATELIELPNHGTSYGTPVTTLIAQLTYGGGVGTDGNGDVYVSGQTAATKGAIYFVPASGSPVLVGTGFYFAFALDSVSNIYVVQANFSDQAEIVEIPQATPPSLTFATTAVGTTSADSPKTVTVTNVGNEALDFYASSSYPTDFPENSSDSKLCNAEFPLNPGAECDVSVNFTPTTSGPLSEDVTLKDENLNNGSSTQLIPVSGTGGAAVVPIAGLAPSPVTFTGQVQGTTSLPMAVTLSNTGSAALTGITPSITGTNPGDFAIGTGANACGTSLAANSSCSIYVTFTPAGTGGFSATLSVADDASVSPQTATLNGTGVSFVSNVGTAEAAQTVTVPITTAGTLGSIQVLTQGISSLDFTTATGGTCTTGTAYTVGQSCTVNVIFNPRSPGPRRGAVQLLDGSGNLLATAFLPGVGTSPQDIFAITTSGSFVPAAQETILAGSVGSSAYTLSFPYDVAVDAAGNVYTADQGSNQINKWTATGGLIPSGATPTALGFGNGPEGIAVDGAGNVFASIWNVTAVQMLQAQGGYTTVTNICPGCFPSSVADGGAAGIAVDGYGNLFVAGYGSSKVYELSPTNGYSTATAIGSGFNFPQGVAVDSNGNVFVADYGNNAVKEILAPAYTTVVTLESNQGSSFFNHPIRLAVDAADNVWVADYANSVVKELLASSGYTTYNTIGGTYSHPYGVALDAAGNLLIADPNNHAVQDLLFSQPPTLTFASTNVSSTSTDSPKVVAVSNIGNASLDFSLSTDPAYPTDFPENSSGTNLCVSASPLASGGICNVSVNFKPTTSGLLSEDVVLTDNDLNGSGVTQSIPVSGTGLSSLIAQTITFTQPTTPVTYSSGLVIPLSATGGASGNPVILTLDPGSSYTGTYILTGSSLTIASAGTYVIDANQAGNSTYSAAPQVQRTVVVSQATQTITFAQPTTPVTYSAGLTIPLSATGGASGNSVIFSIDASSTGTGSISGSQVIVTSAGTFVIDANQAGNTNYSAAPQVQRTVVVNAPGAQAITFTQPTSPVTYSSGLQITLTATGGASGNPVVFTIDGSSTGSGSISGSTLTVTTVGSFTIDANQAGNSSYSAAPQVQRTVVVSQATQTINFTQPTSPVIYSGTSVAVPLSATGGASGNVVVFTIDASSTATGSISGSMLTVTSTGNLVIDANQAGNTDYSAAAQVQRTVVVNTPNSQTIVFTQPTTPVTYSSGLDHSAGCYRRRIG
jgi:N-acetylneuraminic acid mutarotase